MGGVSAPERASDLNLTEATGAVAIPGETSPNPSVSDMDVRAGDGTKSHGSCSDGVGAEGRDGTD